MPCWRLRRHPARGRDGRLVLWTVMPLGSVANDRLRHMLIGAARVSTAAGSQSLAVPCDALQTAATRDLSSPSGFPALLHEYPVGVGSRVVGRLWP